MNIGFDVRMLDHSGIGVRLHHILHFLKDQNHNLSIFLFGDPKIIEKHGLSHFPVIPYYSKIYSIKEFLGHPKMEEMDLLDIPHFNVPIRYLNKCIVTIHDIIPYKMKQFFPEKGKQFYLQLVMFFIKKYALKVISVSEYTKKDLIEEFQFRQESIVTIYNSIDHGVFYPPKTAEKEIDLLKKYNLPSKYLLTVGIGKPHKNVAFVVKNLNSLWSQKKIDIPLVIAGANGIIPDYLLEESKIASGKVIACPHLEFQDLPILYRNSELLIYPSLYEGFGFPVIEAQACGVPVFSSNASVLPEILQNSAYFFEPTNDSSFINSLLQLLSSEEERKKKIQDGIANANRFHWSNSVKQVLELYSSFN